MNSSIVYEEDLKTLSMAIHELAFSRNKFQAANILCKLENLRDSIRSYINDRIDSEEIDCKIKMLISMEKSISNCLEQVGASEDAIVAVITTCSLVVDRCLEKIEDSSLCKEGIDRRDQTRKYIVSKMDDIASKAIPIKSPRDISARYNVIECLIEVLEYIDRDLDIESTTYMGSILHMFSKNLITLRGGVVKTINFFVQEQWGDDNYINSTRNAIGELRSMVDKNIMI